MCVCVRACVRLRFRLLHMAASTKGGSLSTVRLLLAMGADPNACDFGHVPYDRFCETPLKCAIYCGSPEVMQVRGPLGGLALAATPPPIGCRGQPHFCTKLPSTVALVTGGGGGALY